MNFSLLNNGTAQNNELGGTWSRSGVFNRCHFKHLILYSCNQVYSRSYFMNSCSYFKATSVPHSTYTVCQSKTLPTPNPRILLALLDAFREIVLRENIRENKVYVLSLRKGLCLFVYKNWVKVESFSKVFNINTFFLFIKKTF